MALSSNKRKFVAVFDGNSTEAIIKIGLAKRSAKNQGYRYMQDPEVIAAIQARENSDLVPAIATRKERQAFWTELMRNEKLEPRDRLRAAELLGRSEADFTDKLEVKGELTLRELVNESRENAPAKALAAPPANDPAPERAT